MAPLGVTVVAGLLMLFCLLSSSPACVWYRQAPRPRYYSVGRPSGLLQGIRHSQYTRRSGIKEGTTRDLARLGNFLAQDWQHEAMGRWKTVMMCVKEVTAQLNSCAAITEDSSTFTCKAATRLAFGTKTCDPLEH
ncbi:neuropeptide B-like [Rhincodon typus]|uniref:neuropeptide B-like n=1 Tax=Rhincodon typus TaxID=259920 RepID=UPI00202F2C9E|nr:neuropeptide B-like [Rhincodon typus]